MFLFTVRIGGGMVIVAAVDGETTPDPVVRAGHEMATAHDEPLLVLHVMPQALFDERWEAVSAPGNAIASLAPGVQYERRGSGGGEYTVEDGEAHAEGVARAVIEGTLDDDAEATPVGRVGEVGSEVVAEAGRRDASYLVIGGRKRSPVGKTLFGSTTQSVLLSADRPVLTVMGDGDDGDG
jgi:nucleotide-binding universal stress UspA family protein